MSALYVDTSALAKIITTERESDALRVALRGRRLVSSAIASTELLRVGLRLGPSHMEAARRVLDGVHLLASTPSRLRRAGLLEPSHLRSLDALHVVSALDLVDEVGAFVAYDRRLLEAAQLHGLSTSSPA